VLRDTTGITGQIKLLRGSVVHNMKFTFTILLLLRQIYSNDYYYHKSISICSYTLICIVIQLYIINVM